MGNIYVQMTIKPDNPISLGWYTQHVSNTDTGHICGQTMIAVGLAQDRRLVVNKGDGLSTHTGVLTATASVIGYHVSSGSGREDPALL